MARLRVNFSALAIRFSSTWRIMAWSACDLRERSLTLPGISRPRDLRFQFVADFLDDAVQI